MNFHTYKFSPYIMKKENQNFFYRTFLKHIIYYPFFFKMCNFLDSLRSTSNPFWEVDREKQLTVMKNREYQ